MNNPFDESSIFEDQPKLPITVKVINPLGFIEHVVLQPKKYRSIDEPFEVSIIDYEQS